VVQRLASAAGLLLGRRGAPANLSITLGGLFAHLVKLTEGRGGGVEGDPSESRNQNAAQGQQAVVSGNLGDLLGSQSRLGSDQGSGGSGRGGETSLNVSIPSRGLAAEGEGNQAHRNGQQANKRCPRGRGLLCLKGRCGGLINLLSLLLLSHSSDRSGKRSQAGSRGYSGLAGHGGANSHRSVHFSGRRGSHEVGDGRCANQATHDSHGNHSQIPALVVGGLGHGGSFEHHFGRGVLWNGKKMPES
jgi:hypothetical protein